jgi:transcriptional regulator with XRE-family HTH domain
MTLSEIVKNYREENGISQREFAKRCELSNSLISIIERGVNPQTGNPVDPDSRTLRRLAAGMGMTELRLLELLKSNNRPPAFASDLNEYDRNALEALHQNPKLRMLFDLQVGLKPQSLDAVTAVVKEIAKERGEE